MKIVKSKKDIIDSLFENGGTATHYLKKQKYGYYIINAVTNEIEYHYTYFSDKNWLCIGNARRFNKGIFKQTQTHGDMGKVIASEISRLGLSISNKN